MEAVSNEVCHGDGSSLPVMAPSNCSTVEKVAGTSLDVRAVKKGNFYMLTNCAACLAGVVQLAPVGPAEEIGYHIAETFL